MNMQLVKAYNYIYKKETEFHQFQKGIGWDVVISLGGMKNA